MIKKNKSVKNFAMRKINLIFQEILKITLIYLFCFIWIRFLIRKLWLSILLSLCLTAIIYLTIYFFQKRKQNKTGLKLKEKEEAEDMFLSLACENEPINFFVKLASKKHKNITKHKHYIVIDHLEEKVKTLLFVDLSFEGLTVPKFMTIYNSVKKEKASKIVICCKEVTDKQLSSFCQNFNEKFLILDTYSTYEKLYKFYDCFPEITHRYKKEKKLAFKDFIAYSFNKTRTKGYLFSAFVLVLSSLFLRMTIYYCIVASILVIFALISQFNPYFNLKTEQEIL